MRYRGRKRRKEGKKKNIRKEKTVLTRNDHERNTRKDKYSSVPAVPGNDQERKTVLFLAFTRK